jgi:hypothetical protein
MAIKDILLPLVGDADAAMVEKCAAVAGEAGAWCDKDRHRAATVPGHDVASGGPVLHKQPH